MVHGNGTSNSAAVGNILYPVSSAWGFIGRDDIYVPQIHCTCVNTLVVMFVTCIDWYFISFYVMRLSEGQCHLQNIHCRSKVQVVKRNQYICTVIQYIQSQCNSYAHDKIFPHGLRNIRSVFNITPCSPYVDDNNFVLQIKRDRRKTSR